MIDFIEIHGYKSIRDMKLEIAPLNILIGANGSGKSNLLSFFDFLRNLYEQNLREYVALRGGTNNFLFQGQKVTERLSFQLSFQGGINCYNVALNTNENKEFCFSVEELLYCENRWQIAQRGTEARLKSSDLYRAAYIRTFIRNCRKYHFHDTTPNSPLKNLSSVTNDTAYLYSDGGNLAAWLYHIRQESGKNYDLIVKVVHSVAPYFSDFYLEPNAEGYISLRWKDKWADKIWGVADLSDGTLRFIALATLFLQPQLPDTIIIDEPELGLHPFAIAKLSGLLRSAAARGTQVIAATQSVTLIDNFAPEDVVAVDLVEGASQFRRLNREGLATWLENYSLGEMWERDLLNLGHINYH
ncbi:MAG: AAA family ATPase [Bacteroides sp.]